eukprot:m.244297 g.244297  ORF g.244297 m.244297 type:complete len:264 (+) comp16103_c0_seq12:18-809(+)
MAMPANSTESHMEPTAHISEMKNLVAETLRRNGTLSRIQAELRAAVYFTLDPNQNFESSERSHPSPLVKENFLRFAETDECHVILGLIQDFLSFYGLINSEKVFASECSTENFRRLDRKDIEESLNLPSNKSFTLLSLLLQQLQKKRDATGDTLSSPSENPIGVGLSNKTFPKDSKEDKVSDHARFTRVNELSRRLENLDKKSGDLEETQSTKLRIGENDTVQNYDFDSDDFEDDVGSEEIVSEVISGEDSSDFNFGSGQTKD